MMGGSGKAHVMSPENLWYIDIMKTMLLALLLSPDGRRR